MRLAFFDLHARQEVGNDESAIVSFGIRHIYEHTEADYSLAKEL